MYNMYIKATIILGSAYSWYDGIVVLHGNFLLLFLLTTVFLFNPPITQHTNAFGTIFITYTFEEF